MDHDKAGFYIQRYGKAENLMDITDVVLTDTHIGLDADTITTILAKL